MTPTEPGYAELRDELELLHAQVEAFMACLDAFLDDPDDGVRVFELDAAMADLAESVGRSDLADELLAA